MRTDKADVNHLYLKFDHYDQSVIVPFLIENIVLVSNAINTIEILFNVSKRLPTGRSGFSIPVLYSRFGIRSVRLKFYQCSVGNNPHLRFCFTQQN